MTIAPRRPFLLALSLALLAAGQASAAPPAGFEARVEALRTEYGVPGAAVAIVENGRPTLVRGWGTRELGRNQPVDADTIFATGSTGKAFTAAALALLVDQGRLKWDDKVIDHMPYFRMYDPWVTRELTVRDLLVHRSGLGLGAGDLLFVPNSDRSRKDVTLALANIKPSTSFRSDYAYDNILYIVAGQLIEEVSGLSWEQFISRNIYRPLGMSHSTASEADLFASRNRAQPHARIDGPVRGLGTQVKLGREANISPVAAPAGGLAISANDMVHWLQAQLGRGKVPGGATLFSTESAEEMWKPTVIMPVTRYGPEFDVTAPTISTYALGWNVQDYRGAKLIWHSGGVFGSLAIVALLPNRDVGLFIAINSEEGEMVRGLMYELLDHYLGLPPGGWPEKFRTFRVGRVEAAAKALAQPTAQPARTNPSLPLSRYAGEYSDPWYGRISVREAGGRLSIDFPHSKGMNGALDHWQYDTFKTRFADPAIEPALVTFAVDADGKVARVTMKPASPVADFSYDYRDLDFTPVAAGAGK